MTIVILGEDEFVVVSVAGGLQTGGVLGHFKTPDDARASAQKLADELGVEFMETETA